MNGVGVLKWPRGLSSGDWTYIWLKAGSGGRVGSSRVYSVEEGALSCFLSKLNELLRMRRQRPSLDSGASPRPTPYGDVPTSCEARSAAADGASESGGRPSSVAGVGGAEVGSFDGVRGSDNESIEVLLGALLELPRCSQGTRGGAKDDLDVVAAGNWGAGKRVGDAVGVANDEGVVLDERSGGKIGVVVGVSKENLSSGAWWLALVVALVPPALANWSSPATPEFRCDSVAWELGLMRAAARLNTPRAARPKIVGGCALVSACLPLVPTTRSDCDGPVRGGRPGRVGSCMAGTAEEPLLLPTCESKSGVEWDMRENREGVADLRGVRGGGPWPRSYGPEAGASGPDCCRSGNGNDEGG